MIRKSATLMVGAPLGYKNGIKDNTPLILNVVDKSSTGITVTALNGNWKSSSDHTMLVPEIPAGTTFFPMAVCLSESEVEVEPNNALPIENVCYLQKKA